MKHSMNLTTLRVVRSVNGSWISF